MKRKFIPVIALAAGIICLTQTASAHRIKSNTSSHPLRIVAYPYHALGYAMEQVIFRPIHYLVSQPDVDVWVGHETRVGEEETFFEYSHGDYTPTIRERRAAYESTKG